MDRTRSYAIHPIAWVHSSLRQRADAPKQGREGAPDARLELAADLVDGLEGIEAGQEIVILTWLHEADRGVLKVHPRDDLRNPLTGVFATRSPDRPNPIGLHRVTVLEIVNGRWLHVQGLEAIDGTPVDNAQRIPPTSPQPSAETSVTRSSRPIVLMVGGPQPSRRGVDPAMRGIFVQRQSPFRSCHRPEIVQPVTWRRGHGVIAVRQQHRIAVENNVRDHFAVSRVQHLMAEALRRVDAVVVDLFENRLAVAPVVFVGREAAPVPGRVERLADHQPPDVRIGHEEIVDFARIQIAAALLRIDILRAHDGHLAARGRRCRHQHRLERRLGVDDERFARRQAQRGRPFGEHSFAADIPSPARRPRIGRDLPAGRRPFLRRVTSRSAIRRRAGAAASSSTRSRRVCRAVARAASRRRAGREIACQPASAVVCFTAVGYTTFA